MAAQIETDVLIIGGGATGGGLAWDLALRGVRVILAEMGDLATGTSGRYHGLLHSGGRYAVRDSESARECIDENRIVRRIAPESIEDTGGYFILCPGDDETYVQKWLDGCAAVGIPTEPVTLAAARRREPTINPAIGTIYHVPDATCDSWDLLHALQRGAEQTGRARFLTYHRVEAFHRQGDRIVGARLHDLRTRAEVDVTCAVVVNAAGPWAAEVGAKAGVRFGMKLSRGGMLAYNIRWVNTVLNKLRAPGDGDIFVPVGTVSVIGTTSVATDEPGDTRVEAWEIARILDEAEAMTPGISRARILRAWGGVRPLFDPGTGDGRSAKRTFVTLDHAEADGVAGLISIVGGKLTTFRLMAERVADLVCAKLNVTAACTTATTVLPGETHLHHLGGRLDRLEHDQTPGALICECELVTEPQIRAALDTGTVLSLNDLRRDLRLGMGPCQGGFCAYRAAGICHDTAHRDTAKSDTVHHQAAASRALLTEFVERRFGGVRPLLWGHNLRQALLAEHLYTRVVGLGRAEAPHARRLPLPDMSHYDAAHSAFAGDPRPQVVVIGAGLAGLTAARVAQTHGARVHVVAAGQGALTLHPGWIEVGDVTALAQDVAHPYHHAGGALEHGLAALHAVMPLAEAAHAITALGTLRPVAFAAGSALPPVIEPGARVQVVGISGWRDFYATLCRDGLRANGFAAESAEITLPHMGGKFDNWTVDYAHFLDTPDGLARLLAQLGEIARRQQRADILALPAVLGFRPETRAAVADFVRETWGAALCEIPTLTPSVPGLRLYRALREAILADGGRFSVGLKVGGLETRAVSGVHAVTGIRAVTAVRIESAANGRAYPIPADTVILATGGLYGGGLDSDYKGHVWETVADLPVFGVPPLGEWFTQPMTHTEGAPQPIHHAGIRVDAAMRPLDAEGNPVFANGFAAGRLLGGYSSIAEANTEGVDIATGAAAALQAVEAARLAVGSTTA